MYSVTRVFSLLFFSLLSSSALLMFKVCLIQGKAFKEKATKNVDWKEKAVKHISEAGKTLKTQANKVSHRLRKWWRSKTSTGSTKKTVNKAEL